MLKKKVFSVTISQNNGVKKINAFPIISRGAVLPVVLLAVLVELFVVCLLLAWQSKFWTISAHCASGGEETSRESHPSASASIPTDPSLSLEKEKKFCENAAAFRCVVGTALYKTAAAAARSSTANSSQKLARPLRGCSLYEGWIGDLQLKNCFPLLLLLLLPTWNCGHNLVAKVAGFFYK